MFKTSPQKVIWLAPFFVLVLTSCGVNKYLDPQKELLVANKIKLAKGESLNNKAQIIYDLSTLYKQKPNEKWFFFFKIPLWSHFRLDETREMAKTENGLERGIRNLAERRIAETPSYFDENSAESAAQSMQYYLQNRGYFDAEVFYDKYNKNDKDVEVTYYLKPKNLYRIDTTIFISEDSVLNKFLQKAAQNTFLKKGQPVDGRIYDLEVSRLTTFFRNEGYAFFTPNYIAPLEADTSNYKAKIKLEILPPGKGRTHQRYLVGEVTVNPRYNPVLDTLLQPADTINGVLYVKEPEQTFWVKPEALQDLIYLRPGMLYRQEDLDKTNRQLSDLGVYRFVNIRQKEDSITGQVLDFEINLVPRKKWEFGGDVEPNFTERNFTTNKFNLFGLSGGLSLQNRNLMGNAESLSANGSFGFELNLGGKRDNTVRSIFNTLDTRLSFDLFKPQFWDYFGIYKGLRRVGLIRKDFYDLLQEKAPTKISLGYNYLSIYQFYNYHLLNASLGYDIRRSQHRYIINHFSINYLDPTTESDFEVLLESNPFLKRSFGDQLFSGFLFRDFNYFFTSRTSRFGESTIFQLSTELSGFEVWAVNEIYNRVSSNPKVFTLGKGVEFSQFGKLEFDVRHYRQFTPKHSIALRANIGIARPFGFSEEVPYVSQFYVGGPQSIRAWGARGLGPGSYLDPLTENSENRLLFYQTGDFKMEFNAEYRFDMFKIWSLVTEGAVFLDFGNVWTIEADERLGGQLQWRPKKAADGTQIGDNFLKEFAIGTGFGLRFDFNYFIFRLDMGYRVKNPYKKILEYIVDPENPDNIIVTKSTYWTYQSFDQLRLDDINFNLGINYPF